MNVVGIIRYFLLMACLFTALPGEAVGETRRALIVGIDKYFRVNADDRAGRLHGAVNDARGIQSVLIANFGFKPEDIVFLPDELATRERIVKELREHLVGKAEEGDLSLFYFAGHGSWLNNQRSREGDKMDETIVPVDANRGVPDITDKQLAILFNAVLLDKKARLIALFDSCHSGSVARGLPGPGRARIARPALLAPQNAGEPASKPGELGALILAAAQSQERAIERAIAPGGPIQGVFTTALLQVLRSPSAQQESALRVFQRTRALMIANAATQDPELDSSTARTARSFLGGEVGGSEGRSVVAVSAVRSRVVDLQGGLALGLQPGAELLRVGSGPPVRVVVTEVKGMSLSQGTVQNGNPQAVKPGDLFAVERYGAPTANALKVYIPTGATTDALLQLAHRLAPLQKDPLWVADPTEGEPATHVLLRDKSSWVLKDRDGRITARLGDVASLETVRTALRNVPRARLFVQLPLPANAHPPALGEHSVNNAVQVVAQPEEADYLLVGRPAGDGIQYAWILPGATSATAGRTLPARSDWVDFASDGSGQDQLTRFALSLNKIKSWHTLIPPTPADPQFPYRLVLRRQGSAALLGPTDNVRDGETWDPLLLNDSTLTAMERRYFYIFTIDSHGKGLLLYPGAQTGKGENSLPDDRAPKASLPKEVQLGPGLAIRDPFGLDTLILVSSATPIESAQTVFAFDGVRAPGIRRPADPLSALLFGVGENRRSSPPVPPTQWSLQRILLQSIPK